MSLRSLAFLLAATALAACGADTGARVCEGSQIDTNNDSSNCGACGNVCANGLSCQEGVCASGECRAGTMRACYTGQPQTQGVGPCSGGSQTCDDTGTWGRCVDEVVPLGENGDRSMDGIDNNCNGQIDEDVDADGDGQTTHGGDCCDSTECDGPALVNDGAFDAPGNSFDDDCNGLVDDSILICDGGIPSGTTEARDFAKAIDICQETTPEARKWGLISAALTLTDGTGVPAADGHSVRPKYGTNLGPRGGVSLAILSTGAAAAKNDTNPAYRTLSYTHTQATSLGCTTGQTSPPYDQCAPYPADFFMANNSAIPNAPNCPEPLGEKANDPVMLTLEVKVPTNAKSFKLSTNFYSSEFPEYTCSEFNDFFVVLLDSTYTGTTPNPTDKNLAFYAPSGSSEKYPVGVNLGHGDTGLFTQCQNGETGCFGDIAGNITTCTAVDQLAGTGFDDPRTFNCEANSIAGGATGWLVTSGNVTPGEIIKLRIAIWDTSDHILDSTVVIDGFEWSIDVATPGTIIFKENPNLPKLAVPLTPAN